ncbi:DUF4389 domain-containing protein [Nocardioides sp. GCM10027113]|uniref:DUF4389 domain-containing protein n=1 Tax=unclassified Nocardioides TaxID=2615069 RepID=UPI00361336BC
MSASTHPVPALPPPYPVRVDAALDERLSRGLWLVKWLLAVPHFLVLVLLWAAFLVLSVVALVAIVVTGRYPRGIFDFNVGVLRWTWRVTYYSYGGLGTDRYPPFTLAERPDYPAHLEVAYPEHLSRGLALVKWWLLAIPHYLAVAIFVSGGWYAGSQLRNDPQAGGIGLITLLVLVAAVVLLFTGRYPRAVFDLVLGLNRWVLRVAAYAALMTDVYPPFRLDMGGADPGGKLAVGQRSAAPPAGPVGPPASPIWPPPASQPGAPPSAGRPPRPPDNGPRRFGAGRVVAVVLSALAVLVALGLLAAGTTLLVVDNAVRDDDGFLRTDSVQVSSPGHAVVSESIDLADGSAVVGLPSRWLGEVTLVADAAPGEDVFVGVARTADVDFYLTGVAHSVVVEPGAGADQPVATRFEAGGSPALAPTEADFWVVSATGPGRQDVVWDATGGSWTLVVMAGDGTAPVQADVAVGAEVPALGGFAVGLLVAGGLLLLVSVALLLVAAQGSRERI